MPPLPIRRDRQSVNIHLYKAVGIVYPDKCHAQK